MTPYEEEVRTLAPVPFGTRLREGDLVHVTPVQVEPDLMPTKSWLGVVENWVEDEHCYVARCVDMGVGSMGDGTAPRWAKAGDSYAYYLKPGCEVRLLRRAGRKP